MIKPIPINQVRIPAIVRCATRGCSATFDIMLSADDPFVDPPYAVNWLPDLASTKALAESDWLNQTDCPTCRRDSADVARQAFYREMGVTEESYIVEEMVRETGSKIWHLYVIELETQQGLSYAAFVHDGKYRMVRVWEVGDAD